MATLNVKNFPEEIYEKLHDMAERDRRSLSQQVVHLLARATEDTAIHSLLALRGLGREVWEDIDPAGHVRKERTSWD